MSAPPHTAVHWNSHIFWSPKNYFHPRTEPIDQTHFTTYDLISSDGTDSLIIEDFLGKGGFGAAFKCILQGNSYVIKLPVTLIEFVLCVGNARDNDFKQLESTRLYDFVHSVRGDRYIQRMHTSDGTPTQIKNIGVAYTEYHGALINGQNDLRNECMHAEAILEPPVYILRSSRKYHHAGQPIKGLTPQGYKILIKEMLVIRKHPGHKHWHPILHADFNIPCIISEAADGSLSDLMSKLVHNRIEGIYFDHANPSGIPPFWLTVAHQVGLALEYMNTHAYKVHIDMKPPNILFKYTEGQHHGIHLWVADYGLCLDKSAFIDNRNIAGTRDFFPDVLDTIEMNKWYDGSTKAFDLTVHQYMKTLMACLIIKESNSTIRPFFNRFHPHNLLFTEDVKPWILGNPITTVPEYSLVWASLKGMVNFQHPNLLTDHFKVFLDTVKNLAISHTVTFVLRDDSYRTLSGRGLPVVGPVLNPNHSGDLTSGLLQYLGSPPLRASNMQLSSGSQPSHYASGVQLDGSGRFPGLRYQSGSDVFPAFSRPHSHGLQVVAEGGGIPWDHPDWGAVDAAVFGNSGGMYSFDPMPFYRNEF